VCVPGFVGFCMGVGACSLASAACNVNAPCCDVLAHQGPPYFSTRFWEKVNGHKMFVLIFSTNFV
jgi:hypothetical protein